MKKDQELIEGALYRCVGGELELVEPDLSDERMRLKITPHAGGALKRARARVTKALRIRPELDAVASALIEVNADQAPEQQYERWLYLRINRPQQDADGPKQSAPNPRGKKHRGESQ